MSSAEYSCKLFQTQYCIQANRVDPDQTAPRGAIWSGSTLFEKMQTLITCYIPQLLIWVNSLLRYVRILNTALWVKFAAEDILNWYFSYFSQETGFGISCKLSPLETICMKCQNLFSGKNKQNIINLLSAVFALRVVRVKINTIPPNFVCLQTL